MKPYEGQSINPRIYGMKLSRLIEKRNDSWENYLRINTQLQVCNEKKYSHENKVLCEQLRSQLIITASESRMLDHIITQKNIAIISNERPHTIRNH